MAVSSERAQSQLRSQREHRPHNNPFAKRFNSKLDKAPIEEYIKSWIEDIFYNNRKIDIQAKATIYRKLISEKFYELSSCSIVYSIIREKVKEICFKLRRFINHSHDCLQGQQRFLCNLAAPQPLASEGKRGEDASGMLVPLAKVYVISYRYMCEVAKETFNFWKILYECTQVKDLRFNSLQSSLNQFILDTYVQASEAFEPRIMLQAMSFPLKCKFIYAEVEGIKRREELTGFYEDETVKKLFVKREDRKQGLVEQELARMRGEFQRPEERLNLNRKYEMLFHKPRVDHRDIEHLRKYYLSQEANEEALFNSLFASISHEPAADRDTGFSQEKLDLIKSLESNSEKLFEIEDASSQDDNQEGNVYYDQNDPDKEELIDEQDNLEIELMNPEKLVENRETEGSSKSQHADQSAETHDLPMRNYQNQPPPPEFVMPEGIRDQGPYTIPKNRSSLEQALEALEMMNNYNQERRQSSEQELHEQKLAQLKANIAKSKEMRVKEKKIEFLDKRQLEQEKEKLEKYRRELQKQKEELLRQVQKFMKQKKKETNLLALIKENKHKYKFTKNNYKCGINHKIIHKLEKHQQKIESITLKYDLNGFDQDQEEPQSEIKYTQMSAIDQQTFTAKSEIKYTRLEEPAFKSRIKWSYMSPFEDPEVTQIMHDKYKMKQIQQAIAKDLDTPKPSKKQQKLKKKQEHEAALPSADEIERLGRLDSKKEKTVLTEQELNLNRLLDRLQIDEEWRVPCNVEQSQLLRWKTLGESYKSGQPLPVQPQPSTEPPQPKPEPKKKKKSRR